MHKKIRSKRVLNFIREPFIFLITEFSVARHFCQREWSIVLREGYDAVHLSNILCSLDFFVQWTVRAVWSTGCDIEIGKLRSVKLRNLWMKNDK